MTKTELIQKIRDRKNIGLSDVFEMERVVLEYPYFQSMRVVYLKELKERGLLNYEKELSKTAAYVFDRVYLYDYIKGDERREAEKELLREKVSVGEEGDTLVGEGDGDGKDGDLVGKVRFDEKEEGEGEGDLMGKGGFSEKKEEENLLGKTWTWVGEEKEQDKGEGDLMGKVGFGEKKGEGNLLGKIFKGVDFGEKKEVEEEGNLIGKEESKSEEDTSGGGNKRLRSLEDFLPEGVMDFLTEDIFEKKEIKEYKKEELLSEDAGEMVGEIDGKEDDFGKYLERQFEQIKKDENEVGVGEEKEEANEIEVALEEEEGFEKQMRDWEKVNAGKQAYVEDDKERKGREELGKGGEKYSFLEWLEISRKEKEKKEERGGEKGEIEDDRARKFGLIDKFLEENPKIPAPKKGETRAGEDPYEEIELPEMEMATETMAKVYLAQGMKKEAVSMYRALKIKQPERAGYFEEKIKEIMR